MKFGRNLKCKLRILLRFPKSLAHDTNFHTIRNPLSHIASLHFTHFTMTIDATKIDEIAKKIRKPHVNANCIGCAACTAISGDVFDIDGNGLSTVKPCASYEGMDVDDAIAACPVGAITWQEADEQGNYLGGLKEHDNA